MCSKCVFMYFRKYLTLDCFIIMAIIMYEWALPKHQFKIGLLTIENTCWQNRTHGIHEQIFNRFPKFLKLYTVL